MNGRALAYTYEPGSNRLDSAANDDIVLDANGNTITAGSRSHTFTPDNRLLSVYDNGRLVATYAYNALGQRVGKIPPGGGTTRFIYGLAGELLAELDSAGNPRREYVWLEGVPLAVIDASGVYYIHTDHLGTPRAVSDGNGRLVWRWVSTPFGQGAPDEDPDGDGVGFTLNLRFPGQYFDAETGLHYNYFRYYDPATGRYITADPIGLQGGLNTYFYVNANALRGTDPRGLLPVMPWPTGDIPSPDYSPCSYYDQKCTETGCRYYCTTAPAICRNAERLPLFWGINNSKLNCIRRCLVREDKKIHDRRTQCTDNDCLSDQEIDNYHNRCFTECGVSPSRYPGVNPPWFPGNPNAPNRPN